MTGRFDVADALAVARRAIAEGREAATAVVVEAGDPSLVGRRLAWDGCRHFGDLESPVTTEARALLESSTGPGCHSLAGGIELYVERWVPPADLVIVGAGHVAQPLALVGSMLDFRVTVLDDRPEFATRDRFPGADRVLVADFADPLAGIEVGPRTSLVLVTRGHRHDYDCLRQLARRGVQPRYLGMIGSRRRVRAAFEQLAAEGVSADWLARVHAPLGLDIGAETPAEIAIAVAAEIVLVARGGSGRPLSERAQVLRHVRALAVAPAEGP
ncbi:MAG TPA: XdhC family protein [Gemmatimonadota bacterium]|nr:XdhC family protein [Gemmatimonadota bacterium]